MCVNSLSQGPNVDPPKAGLEPRTSRSESRASATIPRRHETTFHIILIPMTTTDNSTHDDHGDGDGDDDADDADDGNDDGGDDDNGLLGCSKLPVQAFYNSSSLVGRVLVFYGFNSLSTRAEVNVANLVCFVQVRLRSVVACPKSE
ncbi:hypothetical protein ElyMa_004789900 [Elysia marginata]|uniref:PITH domain-containing protein n=1 Tax=Elysia marginata TaxID=1093978 RepID=A0AAV4IMJ2_9GAST|nr:hypothetical protein ElyMa_004789900 [Elysia marginata]